MKICLILCILLWQVPVSAQSVSMNTIPLNESIDITLLGSDTELLYCYNLYGFHYFNGTDTVMGEFIVLKSEDTYKDKVDVTLKLCRVKEFSLMIKDKCRSIQTNDAMEIKHPGEKEKIFLNFNPDGPEPVFIPCKM